MESLKDKTLGRCSRTELLKNEKQNPKLDLGSTHYMSSIFEKRNPKLDLGSTPRKEGSTFGKNEILSLT